MDLYEESIRNCNFGSQAVNFQCFMRAWVCCLPFPRKPRIFFGHFSASEDISAVSGGMVRFWLFWLPNLGIHFEIFVYEHFYGHQCFYAPARPFMSRYSNSKSVPPPTLRQLGGRLFSESVNRGKLYGIFECIRGWFSKCFSALLARVHVCSYKPPNRWWPYTLIAKTKT